MNSFNNLLILKKKKNMDYFLKSSNFLIFLQCEIGKPKKFCCLFSKDFSKL